jgi:hypothetical protein
VSRLQSSRSRARVCAGAVRLLPLCPLRRDQAATVEDNDFPLEDVPGWAYDVYSREGRAALANFIEGRTKTARWVRAHIPSLQRVAFLGGRSANACGGRPATSCGAWWTSSATARTAGTPPKSSN